jgi:hypothetical protein
MYTKKNPAAVASGRALNVKAFDRAFDQNPNEIHGEFQSEMLAVRCIMRRFRVSYYHAKTICQLSGFGGQAI